MIGGEEFVEVAFNHELALIMGGGGILVDFQLLEQICFGVRLIF